MTTWLAEQMFQVKRPLGMAPVSTKKLEKRAVPWPNTLMTTDWTTEGSELVIRMYPVLPSAVMSMENTWRATKGSEIEVAWFQRGEH
jgi:hypothetical protein